MRGPNGTIFDLSSAFHPDVAEYGVAVPPTFRNGTLCLLPMQGGHCSPAQNHDSSVSC